MRQRLDRARTGWQVCRACRRQVSDPCGPTEARLQSKCRQVVRALMRAFRGGSAGSRRRADLTAHPLRDEPLYLLL